MAKKDRREVILRAAERMIRDRRFHELTLDEVASAAHVGKGTIYRYFRDKDDLFFQLATDGHDALCQAIEESAAADADVPFERRLVAMCERIAQFFESRRTLMRVMFEQQGRFPALNPQNREVIRNHMRRLHTAVAGVLEKGVPRGHLRRDIPLDAQAHFLMNLLRTHGPGPEGDLAERPPIPVIVDVFLHGVQSVTPAETSAETERQS